MTNEEREQEIARLQQELKKLYIQIAALLLVAVFVAVLGSWACSQLTGIGFGYVLVFVVAGSLAITIHKTSKKEGQK